MVEPRVSITVAVCVLTLVQTAWGDSLADYVAPEAALYAEIESLDRDWRDLESSRLGEQWRASPLYDLFASSPMRRRWQQLDDKVAAETGETLTQRLRSLFARSVAVAVFVPTQGEPQAILLARGRSEDAVKDTVAAWNRVEPQVQLETRKLGSHDYVARRVGRNTAKAPIFYAVVDDVFVLSDQEALVQDALRRVATPQASPALSADAGFRAMWPSTRPAGTALAYVAPRRWDTAFRRLSDGSPASDALLSAWSGVSGVLGRLSLNAQAPSAELSVSFDPATLSPQWQEFVAASAAPPSIAQQAPEEALLAIGGRLQPAMMVAALRSLMPRNDQADWDRLTRSARAAFLDHDPWSEVAAALLHDWSLYVVERPLDQQRPLRRHPFVAVWTSRLPATSTPSTLQDGLQNGLSFLMTFASIALNTQSQGATVSLTRVETDDGTELHLTGRPEGELAVRFEPDRLLVTTSVAELQTVSTTLTAPQPAALAATAREYFPQAAVLGWLNLRRMREAGWPALLRGGDEPSELRPVPQAALLTATDLLDEVYAAASWSETKFSLLIGTRPRAAD